MLSAKFLPIRLFSSRIRRWGEIEFLTCLFLEASQNINLLERERTVLPNLVVLFRRNCMCLVTVAR